ncbi:MAG: hypothetical protein KDA24_17570 [Deltaproteobacteria bacterium]|nr:hypothetical protein [Deltaproteobacteria bacterium]
MASAGSILLGCPSGDAPDPGPPAEDIPPPDLSDVDLDAALFDGIEGLTRTSMRALWAGHLASLDRMGPSCPTLWTGVPSGVGDGDGGEDGAGWQDDCTAGVTAYDGSVAWETSANPDAPVLGSRSLAAIATVVDAGDDLFSFRGEASDSLRLDESGARWTYTSSVNGAASGSAVLDPTLASVDGWRGISTVSWVGGARWSIDASANVAFVNELLAGRFDAVDADAFIPGPGAEDLGCALEPHGRISLRLPPGDWVDVQFWQPPPEESPEEIVTNACDGCGTVTVRGVPLGGACPDFSPLWTAERLPSAALDDFVLSLREQLSEDQ